MALNQPMNNGGTNKPQQNGPQMQSGVQKPGVNLKPLSGAPSPINTLKPNTPKPMSTMKPQQPQKPMKPNGAMSSLKPLMPKGPQSAAQSGFGKHLIEKMSPDAADLHVAGCVGKGGKKLRLKSKGKVTGT